jgi:catechol 2,3-dioxygenase-like lactoylglutathione lyase family enzyme
VDERPPVWIGHELLAVSDIDRSADWWSGIGMREVERNEQAAILELRGGTHLVLVPGEPKAGGAPFDLMVEDLDATHGDWSARGIQVGAITEGRNHTAFEATDPDGYVVTVYSTHVVGTV